MELLKTGPDPKYMNMNRVKKTIIYVGKAKRSHLARTYLIIARMFSLGMAKVSQSFNGMPSSKKEILRWLGGTYCFSYSLLESSGAL